MIYYLIFCYAIALIPCYLIFRNSYDSDKDFSAVIFTFAPLSVPATATVLVIMSPILLFIGMDIVVDWFLYRRKSSED